jgi:hypothetical protein
MALLGESRYSCVATRNLSVWLLTVQRMLWMSQIWSTRGSPWTMVMGPKPHRPESKLSSSNDNGRTVACEHGRLSRIDHCGEQSGRIRARFQLSWSTRRSLRRVGISHAGRTRRLCSPLCSRRFPLVDSYLVLAYAAREDNPELWHERAWLAGVKKSLASLLRAR